MDDDVMKQHLWPAAWLIKKWGASLVLVLICKKRKNQWLMVNLVFERGENQVHQAIQISVQISLLGQACVSVMLV